MIDSDHLGLVPRPEISSATPPFEFLHMNHINAVVQDFESTLAHFQRVYDAQLVMDMPQREWHACLIHLCGVIFELFVPHEFLLNARYGPHYVGIEYQVPDLDVARDLVSRRGMRIVRDLGHTIHTDPSDGLGVAWELYCGNFHADPAIPWLEPLKPVSYWRNQHPLGLVGLERYTIAVSDIATSAAFLVDALGARRAYEADRADGSARCIGFSLADTTVELVSPVADGPISRYLARYGDGIRASVFRVQDLHKASAYFQERGVALQTGDAPSTIAVEGDDNGSLRFEFTN